MRPFAVIDIDGVLADVSHRLHYLERYPKDWDRFFAGVGADSVYAEGQALADELAAEHDVIYLSGRPERTRRATETWLREHAFPAGEVLLRGDDDRRPARQFKLARLRRLTQVDQPGRTVAVLVDDDPAVCRAARGAGFVVFEATWNRPDPTLFDAQEGEGRT